MDRRQFLTTAAGSALLFKAAACSDIKETCEGDCENLYPFFVASSLCTGCAICVPKCRKEAISFPSKGRRALIVNQEKCIHCSKCLLVCEYDSVIQVPVDGGSHPFEYYVNLDTCVNCMECYNKCRAPVQEGGPGVAAIEIFNPESRATIDQGLCSHCGECVELEFCPNQAIFEGPTDPIT